MPRQVLNSRATTAFPQQALASVGSPLMLANESPTLSNKVSIKGFLRYRPEAIWTGASGNHAAVNKIGCGGYLYAHIHTVWADVETLATPPTIAAFGVVGPTKANPVYSPYGASDFPVPLVKDHVHFVPLPNQTGNVEFQLDGTATEGAYYTFGGKEMVIGKPTTIYLAGCDSLLILSDGTAGDLSSSTEEIPVMVAVRLST